MIEQVLERYYDSDINSSTYGQRLNTYNPLYDMHQGSFDETTSFGFTNNFEIDWQVFDGLRAKDVSASQNPHPRERSLSHPIPPITRKRHQPSVVPTGRQGTKA